MNPGDSVMTEQGGSEFTADSVWIIHDGDLAGIDLKTIDDPAPSGPVKVYYISDLAKYLLNPNPVQVKKKLVGCEIHHTIPFSKKLRQRIRSLFGGRKDSKPGHSDEQPEVLISKKKTEVRPLKDEDLESHFNKIDELLIPYDPTVKRLANMNGDRISTIMGICEDMDGNRSMLNLQGDINEKIGFVINNISNEVGVVLKSPQIADGLFDLGGFNLKAFDPRQRHRMIRYLQNNEPTYCVLNPCNGVDLRIENKKLVQMLHLLEQSICNNSKLKESLQQCIEGEAMPLKLFFNQQLEIDYSSAHPPELYRQVFAGCQMAITERNVVINTLKNLQLGISLNYILPSDKGEKKLCTSMSVMHDIRALDPIKDIVPEVYTEIEKRTQASEAGRFYLLDSIRGYRNEH